MRCYNPVDKEYTGEHIFVRVVNITTGFGLKDGYCVLGIRFINKMVQNFLENAPIIPPINGEGNYAD